MKILALLLALIIPMPALATPTQSINRAEASTVIVFGDLQAEIFDPFLGMSEEDKYNYPFCSGVLILRTDSYDIVVTARHCVIATQDGFTFVQPTPKAVKFNDGKRYKVIGSAIAPNDDIGILMVTPTDRPTIDIGNTVQRGEDYFVFSMPNGYPWSYTPASSMQGSHYSNAIDPWKYTEMFTCAGCGPGNSGGGVFDESGNLVAISVAGNQLNYMLAVPANRVMAAINDSTELH